MSTRPLLLPSPSSDRHHLETCRQHDDDQQQHDDERTAMLMMMDRPGTPSTRSGRSTRTNMSSSSARTNMSSSSTSNSSSSSSSRRRRRSGSTREKRRSSESQSRRRSGEEGSDKSGGRMDSSSNSNSSNSSSSSSSRREQQQRRDNPQRSTGGTSTNRSSSRRRRRSSGGSSSSSDSSDLHHRDNKQRRVTFEVDEKNRVITYVRKIRPSHEIISNSTKRRKNMSSEEILWWSQDELEAIMEREQNVFEVFSKCCTSYVDTVLQLWQHCETINHHHHSNTAAGTNTEEDELNIVKLANAPARGMENDVLINALTSGTTREKAIESVMKTQRAMSKATLDVRTSTMRRRYKNLSRASAEFAKTIASGDAQVAASILGQ